MFLKKQREQRIIDMANMIKANLPAEVTLVSMDYNGKIFGNIVVVIEFAKVNHIFTTDRGDIYHNGKMLCNRSYHYIENDDTFSKLLKMIKRELDF